MEPRFRHARSQRNFNNIGVRGYIQSGAPIRYKTANLWSGGSGCPNGLFQNLFSPDDAHLVVVNSDRSTMAEMWVLRNALSRLARVVAITLPHRDMEALRRIGSIEVHGEAFAGRPTFVRRVQAPHTSFRMRSQFSPMTRRILRSGQPAFSIAMGRLPKSPILRMPAGFTTSWKSTSLRA